MKKKIALILATMMTVAAIAPCAFAEAETEEGGLINTADTAIEFDYHDIDEDLYDGVWVATGLGFDMYLPADWELIDITDEMAEAGLVFGAGEEGGGANVMITCAALPEEVVDTYDIDALAEELAATYTSATYLDLNGIPAVGFDNDETKTSGFCILPGDGTLITGVIAPPSDDEYEEYGPYFANMFMSVSATEVSETETEA